MNKIYLSFLIVFILNTNCIYSQAPVGIAITGSKFICSNKEVELIASDISGIGTIISYQWKINNLNIPAATNFSYNTNVSGNYSLIIVRSDGTMETSDIFRLEETFDPMISFSKSEYFICANAQLLLSPNIITPAKSITEYNWVNNGAHFSADSYAYTNLEGEYQLFVRDANGCIGKSPKVKVNTLEIPSVSISIPQGPYCNDKKIDIHSVSASGSGTIQKYQWHKDGVQISDSDTSVLAVNVYGNYFLTVTNSNTCTGKSNILNIDIEETPIPIINGNPYFCKNYFTSLDANSSVINPRLNVSYQWFLNNQVLPDKNSIVLDKVGSSGDYSLHITTSNGCKGISPVLTVTEIANPIPEVSGKNLICPNSINKLEISNINPISEDILFIEWLHNGYENGYYDYSIEVSDTGIYSVRVYNQQGCYGVSNDFKVSLDSLKIEMNSPITSSGFNTSCYSSSDAIIHVNAQNGLSPYTYKWSDSATTESLTNISSGTYVVSITDANGCSVADSIYISSPPKLQANAGPDITMCPTKSFQISTHPLAYGGTEPYTYSWTSNAKLSSNIVSNPFVFPDSLNKTVISILTVIDSLGCIDTDTLNVVFHTIDSIDISVTESPTYMPNPFMQLSVISNDIQKYIWSDSSNNSFIEVSKSGTYKVQTSDSNNCIQEDSVYIDFNPEYLLHSYTVLVYEYAKFSQNTFHSGAVGVISESIQGNSAAEFDKNSKLTDQSTFVKASKIISKSGSKIGNSIYKAADGIVLPEFIENPYTNIQTLKLNDGSTNNLNDSIYGKIEIGNNVKIIFSSPRIFIDEITMGTNSGLNMQFQNCSNVYIKNKLNLGKQSVVNPDGKIVTFYIGNKQSNQNTVSTQISGGSVINANMYTPFGDIIIADAVKSKPNILKGQFVSRRIVSGTYTEWSQNSNSSKCNLTAEIIEKINVDCNNENSGFIRVQVHTGVPPYYYSINGSSKQLSNEFKNLKPASYQIEVWDQTGSKTKLSAEIIKTSSSPLIKLQSTLIPDTSDIINSACYSVKYDVTNGVSPYTLEWSLESTEYTDETIYTFCPDDNGYLTLRVTDSLNCVATDSVYLSVPEYKQIAKKSLPCKDCLPTFSPIPGKKYVLSAWVKETSKGSAASNYISAEINVSFPSINITIPPMQPKGLLIDSWQRIEEEFRIPDNAKNIKISLNSNFNTCFFDDIRIFPSDANFKSFVYDPYTMRFVAELDNTNYATFYEYDEEGKLIRLKKETERGVMTITENIENIVKK